MAMSSQRASTSVTSAPQWKYDVFLSFRGEDTRTNFTDHLYEKLHSRGIKTFRDDPELERGTAISSALLTAIEESRFAIVVLSPNYASSTWCLDELSKILECMEARMTILPIFFDVDPSDVRKQMGTFAEAFKRHEETFREDIGKVQQWRIALTKVGHLAGWTSKDRYETKLIQEVVEAVWNNVHPTFSSSTENLVGIDFRLEQIELFLDAEANHVCFIGICGMGGIGKTTIARLVYESISHNFEVSSFLANVREDSATHGLIHLQIQFLSSILKKRELIKVTNVYDGSTLIKNCFCNKKVLLVLDDVDQLTQLEILAGSKDWFGMGSRIIITTRDKHLLLTHGIEKPYEVEGLNQDNAFELFSWKAFRKEQPEEDYLELSKSFVNYAGGLPLALKVLGSFLYKRGKDAWNSTLDKLKECPNRIIFETLKISYDGLDDMEKSIFLDVACFHKGKDKKKVVEILECIGYCASIVIDVLVEKSLINISHGNVEMHDLIQEMGCKIVCQESFDEPGGHSRLWLSNDIVHVLTKNTGTKEIEGIVLSSYYREHGSYYRVHVDWNGEAFSKMCRLRFLQIDNCGFSLGPKYLPNSLRFLYWQDYPSKFLPQGFQPDKLSVLDLKWSKIFELWNGVKYLDKLKYIDLSYSKNLKRTPDFTGIQNLESLVLEGCSNLVEVHPSIAVLKWLKILNFGHCKSIESLPSKVRMESLEVFILSGCSKVKKIPEFVGPMKNLEKLSLNETAIENIPSSIDCLTRLISLDLRACKSLLCLPSAICSLKSLKYLDMSGCSKLDKLPENFGKIECLEMLDLDHTGIEKIPSSIGCLTSLISLDLRDCKRLLCLPSAICNLKSLKNLNMSGCSKLCELPEKLGEIEDLEKLDVSQTGIRAPPVSLVLMKKLKVLSFGSLESRRSILPFGLFPKKSLEPKGLVFASLNGLCSLRELDLGDCNISEGGIPDDIGHLFYLEILNLSGNNFVSLPASIRWLSKLKHFNLERCKRLQQLPGLPSNYILHVNTDYCTSLKLFPDPPKLSTYTDLYEFTFSSVNGFGLVDNQGCNNIVFSILRQLAQGISKILNRFQVLIPGNEIHDWFINQNVGDSVIVELPPQSCSKWMGIALCVVFAAEYKPFALLEYDYYGGKKLTEGFPLLYNSKKTRQFVSDHLWVLYVPRDESKKGSHIRISFGTFMRNQSNTCSNMKCGARVVYEQDIEELNRTVNQFDNSISF